MRSEQAWWLAFRMAPTCSTRSRSSPWSFVDHVAEKTSELALHVTGDTPEQAAAIDALEGAHLIEIAQH